MENNEKFKRNCPCCNKELVYTSVKNRNTAEKEGLVCVDCKYVANIEKNRPRMESKYLKYNDEQNKKIIDLFNVLGTNIKIFERKAQQLINEFEKLLKEEEKNILYYRNCPKCNVEISYKTKTTFNRAEKQQCLCASCCSSGENNGFFGKKHTEESMITMVKTKETSESWQASLEYKKTEEFRSEMSKKLSGENNPRYGLGSLKDIWIKKYGEEQGLKRWEEWKQLQRDIAPRGENAHAYGKQSPVGSGNGWSGYYNFEDGTQWYFRSFIELSYMVNEIVAKKLQWENGELKKFIIPYIDYSGNTRNYFPDFVIDGKYIVECKPENLQSSVNVKAKKEAAEKYCLERGMEYIILEPNKLSEKEIMELYITKKITFIPRYEEKFKQKYLNKEQ